MKYINEKRWKTMILVDKNIKERSTEIFVKNYNEASVNAISYDLHIIPILQKSFQADQTISHDLKLFGVISLLYKKLIRMSGENLKNF